MRLAGSTLIILLFGTLFAPHAHAIIFLPALVLIPIVKIVAVIIAGFSLPAFGVGALLGKQSGRSVKKIIPKVVLCLVVLAVILAVLLKLSNPERPLF